MVPRITPKRLLLAAALVAYVIGTLGLVFYFPSF
jgi:hypothetical protein